MGYNNFGDILQIKGAIKFHRERTGLLPVLVLAVEAISDESFIHNLRRWFNVDAIVFVSNSVYEAANLGLQLLTCVYVVRNVHLYGGGLLNKYWGEYLLRVVEKLISSFRVSSYVVTGQQISRDFLHKLQSHFNDYRPIAVGGRDYESVHMMEEIGVPAGYSFDDASDILWEWRDKFVCRPDTITNSNIFVHMNSSSYTDGGSRKSLDTILQIFNDIDQAYPGYTYTFIQAYSDKRFQVKDTLDTIIDLEYHLPVASFKVIDIAKLALEYQSTERRPSHEIVFNGRLGVSSSYHTALFLNVIGIPCWLIANNEYYEQKRSGLSISSSLQDFLNDPKVVEYNEQISARNLWLQQLPQYFVYDQCSTEVEVTYNVVTSKPVKFKGDGVSEPLRWLEYRVREMGIEIDNQSKLIAELKNWVEELQEGKRWLLSQIDSMNLELENKDRLIQELRHWVSELQRQ